MELQNEQKTDLRGMFRHLPENLITALRGKAAAVAETERQLEICNKISLELNSTAKRLQDLRRKIIGGSASMDEFRINEELKISYKYLRQKADQAEQKRKDWAGTQQAHIQDFGDALTEILDDLKERTRQDWSALHKEIMYTIRDTRDLSPKCLETLASLDKLIGTHQSRTRKAARWIAGAM